ncbi:MAG: FitA-like ribbon-helix-helix domain-containing protein [Opitutales bacterium]
MKTMTIRDVPEEVHAALRERAKRNRRSMNQQVIAELSRLDVGQTEDESRARVEMEIKSINQLRGRMKRFMAAEEIDAAIEEGRR